MALIDCEMCGSVVVSGSSPCSRCGGAVRVRQPGGPGRVGLCVAVVGLVGLGLFTLLQLPAVNLQNARDHAKTSVFEQPMSLEDTTFQIAPSSTRGVPIELPYAGDVRIDVTVAKGSQVNLGLISLADWQTLERARGKTASRRFGYPEFKATNTRHSMLLGHLLRGAYFIVIENPELKDPSAATEVRVSAELYP